MDGDRRYRGGEREWVKVLAIGDARYEPAFDLCGDGCPTRVIHLAEQFRAQRPSLCGVRPGPLSMWQAVLYTSVDCPGCRRVAAERGAVHG